MNLDVLKNKDSLRELYDKYGSMKAVAEKVGCGETIVHTWVHRLGIQPKPRPATQKGKNVSLYTRQLISEQAKRRLGELNSNWRGGSTKKGMTLRGRSIRERRKTVLARDNYECQECGIDYNLHIHHIKPFKDYPQLVNDWSNCITLCATCHRNIHFGKINIANSVNTRAVNAELNGDRPHNQMFAGLLPKCVETIHDTPSNGMKT